MKLTDINSKIVKSTSTQELSNLHFRVHQLYVLANKRDPVKKELILFLEKVHNILVTEMIKRNIKHDSPLTITSSLKLLRRFKSE